MPIQPSLERRGKGLCLLSLDSGGARGVSQLTILAQLMHRLKHDSGDEMGRPCSVFDMIGGVGSGGFIAILLVLFGLNAEQTLDEFIDLSVNILNKQDVDAQTRTVALKQHIDRLLEKYEMNKNTRIFDSNDRSMDCKLAIPLSYKSRAGSICTLRNYSVRKESTLNLTIAEALMATLATPPMFTSTQIIKDAATFGYTGADLTLSNPIEEIIAEAHRALGAEQKVACILSLGCGHPGVFTAPEDSDIVAWNEFLESLVTDSERKAEELDSRMGHLGFYHRFSVISRVEKTIEANRLGDTVTHTHAYLDKVTVSRKLDGCANSLRMRDGVSSLDQIRHSGGRLVLSPQLPPVTEAFVMREEPWKFVKNALLKNGNGEANKRPRRLIITGVAGCGKTQLMLKFMKEHKSELPFQIFIDGSSEDRIRADIIQNVRSLGTEHSQKGFEDCLHFLSSQAENRVPLLFYDNVDDPDIDISSLLPRGDSCVIAITSRNGLLGDLDPKAHLRLGIMALDEAVKLLLYDRDDPHISIDQAKIDAVAVAEALGCLPIALQQARAYMQQTKCLTHEYLERLSTSRKKLLSQPIKYQLDAQTISPYTSFETSFLKLPGESQKLIRLLSYFHWSNFPLELVYIAAKYQFSGYEESEYPQGEDFTVVKSLLEDIFLRDGEWEVINLDTMTRALQNYSLVSVISGVKTSLLQMHPLVHEWVRIYTPENEVDGYQSAAILLLALGARKDRTTATQYLASHVNHMNPLWKTLSTSNAAAFGSILFDNGVYRGAMELQEMVVEHLRQSPDPTDQRLSNSIGHMAEVYHKIGRMNEAVPLQQEVLRLRKEILGERHPDTITALNNIASTYYDLSRPKEAEELQAEVLKVRREILGERHSDTINASISLAMSHRRLGKPNEAKVLLEEASRLNEETLGEHHLDTIKSYHHLAVIYHEIGRLNDAQNLHERVLRHRAETLGDLHPDTLVASYRLSKVYHDQGRFEKAEAHLLGTLSSMRNVLGNRHPWTTAATMRLSRFYCSLHKVDAAREILVTLEPIISDTLGVTHRQYLELQDILSNLPNPNATSDADKRGPQSSRITTEAIILTIALISVLGITLYMYRRRQL